MNTIALFPQVSQHWFPESETTLATAILATSLPIGIVLGYGVTPLFVTSAEDVPAMNWIWFLPAVANMVFAVFAMRTSKPPSPPSLSASYDQESQSYLKRLVSVHTKSKSNI